MKLIFHLDIGTNAVGFAAIHHGTKEIKTAQALEQKRKTPVGCPLIPGAEFCPKGSWLAQQCRMLEKLNNLRIMTGNSNSRPLDAEERQSILDKLQAQSQINCSGMRLALAPLYKTRDQVGAEKCLQFSLGSKPVKGLCGNIVEQRLKSVFGQAWHNHPYKQYIRNVVPICLWQADYDHNKAENQAVMRSEKERKKRREATKQKFICNFGAKKPEAGKLAALTLPPGWDSYSSEALQEFLPLLEDGVPFDTLLNHPDWEDWRDETFPRRVRSIPTGLREVVDNLTDMYGKPDLIRMVLAWDIWGPSQHQQDNTAKTETLRRTANKELQGNGINPSVLRVQKWLLWQECGRQCPYTGDPISFAALFGTKPSFTIEHIWPRSRSSDNSFRNKTLCRQDVNKEKRDRTPYEYLHDDRAAWYALLKRIDALASKKTMPLDKVKRFKARYISNGGTDCQPVDTDTTAYAMRQAIDCLKQLWPEVPVVVQMDSG